MQLKPECQHTNDMFLYTGTGISSMDSRVIQIFVGVFHLQGGLKKNRKCVFFIHMYKFTSCTNLFQFQNRQNRQKVNKANKQCNYYNYYNYYYYYYYKILENKRVQ